MRFPGRERIDPGSDSDRVLTMAIKYFPVDIDVDSRNVTGSNSSGIDTLDGIMAVGVWRSHPYFVGG
jgi:hypothetical protein